MSRRGGGLEGGQAAAKAWESSEKEEYHSKGRFSHLSKKERQKERSRKWRGEEGSMAEVKRLQIQPRLPLQGASRSFRDEKISAEARAFAGSDALSHRRAAPSLQ